MQISLKRKLIRASVVLLLLISITGYVVTNILANRTVYIPRVPYDKTGFIHVSEYEEDHIFEVENDRFQFKLTVSDTKFEVFDKQTQQIWKSNPEEVTGNYPKEFHNLFILYYEMLLETPKSISIQDMSIALGHYQFKEIDQGIEVLYEIGREEKLTFFDLPYQVSSDNYHDLIIAPLQAKIRTGEVASRHVNTVINAFMHVPSTDSYLLLESRFNTEDSIQIVYNLIFNESLYTKEDMEMDRERFGYPTAGNKPYFEFVVRYELSDEGFRVQIINDSIHETEEFQVAYIDVLPYFGANNIHDDGITVIPDGSGILIDHNSGNYVGSTYDKRIYGRDLTVGSSTHIRPELIGKINMPMYGYTKNNHGFINVVESSETMTSIRAGYRLTTAGSVYTNIVPFVHYRYHLRERDSFTFQSYASEQRISLWTKDYNTDDFIANYMFTETDGIEDIGYYELAQFYQGYLVDQYNLEKTFYEDILHLTMLGGYIKQKHFVGFPYDSIQSLTTPKEIMHILDQVNTQNLPIDISYQGWSNNGLKPTVMDKVKFNRNIATEKDIKNLNQQIEAVGHRLFLEFFTQTAFTDARLSKKNDVTKNLLQKNVTFYDYNEAMQLADRSRLPQYQLNMSKQSDIYQNMGKLSYVNHVAITDEGQLLASELESSNTVFRGEIMNQTINHLQQLDKTVALRNANLYGAVHVDKIIDLPINGGSSRIADYGIPFVQLVYNGYLNYTIPSANLDTSRSLDWHKLKAIETGSKMHFTLSYENTVDLIKTQYSHYFSTYYENWVYLINEIIDEIIALDIYSETIISHKTLNIQGTIVEVIYSNGQKFTINYETETLLESKVE